MIPLLSTELDRVSAAIRLAWSSDTSVDPAWSPANPALGQCAVTALVVQDYLGGHLFKTTVAGRAHYWTRIDDVDLDLTREQFEQYDPGPARFKSRFRVLSYPDTAKRYAILQSRTARHLASLSAPGDDNGTRNR